MNQGGEPGHDDYGLPRVDIQVPDDARELYRDVQAYHRELRAQRRQDRSALLRAPLRNSGIVVPLIAGCLVMAMIAGMVLTMFSANPWFSGITGPNPASTRSPRGAHGTGSPTASAGPATSGLRAASPGTAAPGTSPGAASPGSALPGQAGRSQLPGTTITVAGRPVALATLSSAALAMIPAHCRCARPVGRLLSQARSAGIPVYLVGGLGSQREISGLAPGLRPDTDHVAIDAGNILYRTYHPVGLAVLLVDSRGIVRMVPDLRADVRLRAQLERLKPPA